MVKYVQDARRDKVVIDTARIVATQYAAFIEQMSDERGERIDAYNNKVLFAQGLDLWCRYHFTYVNDPTAYEVTQTPNRMIRMTKVPIDVLRKIMEPFYAAMEELEPTFHRGSHSPRAQFVGDCDEPHCVFLGMCACLDLGDPRFAFGGQGDHLHHVWGRIYIDEVPYDSDFTAPGLQFGEKLEFDNYDEVEIPLIEDQEVSRR